MLMLLTGNLKKYSSFEGLLKQLEIRLEKPAFQLLELQATDFLTVLEHKAARAAAEFGSPCLVDDSGLVLDAYPGFPGPMTADVCRMLGAEGLRRLLEGTSPHGRMVCHIGCMIEGKLWHWQGEIPGTLDPRRPVSPDGPGPLSSWFLPDDAGASGVLGHRHRALEALAKDIAVLRAALAGKQAGASCDGPPCVFCQEFNGSGNSVFDELSEGEIPSRIIHQTPHFTVFPPLGQFIEGGLLLATREHIFSMSELNEQQYDDLERLMAETADLLEKRYGCCPLFFEHAPLTAEEKGTCCVNHAHLNVFPANVDVHEQLRKFPHEQIGQMREMADMPGRHRGYLFLQDNQRRRFVYHVGIVPSQYVRRIVTAQLGMPERWHWRQYLGIDELKRTMQALQGWRSSDA